MLTNDPRLAERADRWGVDRIGLDLERLGKIERQLGEGLRLSAHKADELAAIRSVLRRAAAFVRINPIHAETGAEIESVLAGGAQVVMLPYFRAAAEVDRFVRCVDGRARVAALVETAPAAARIRDILSVAGLDEVMVGLNDLRIELGLGNVFELLVSPLLDRLAAEARLRGLPFLVGGVARLDDRSLPVPADLVLAQYPRLGATGAWLSRSFLKAPNSSLDEEGAVAAIRRRLTEWAGQSPEALESARASLAAFAGKIG